MGGTKGHMHEDNKATLLGFSPLTATPFSVQFNYTIEC